MNPKKTANEILKEMNNIQIWGDVINIFNITEANQEFLCLVIKANSRGCKFNASILTSNEDLKTCLAIFTEGAIITVKGEITAITHPPVKDPSLTIPAIAIVPSMIKINQGDKRFDISIDLDGSIIEMINKRDGVQ